MYFDQPFCMKKFVQLSLALIAVIIMLHTGVQGLLNDQAYGLFFTFIGALTTIGLGMDVVSHLEMGIRKNNIRKLRG